MIEHPFHMHVKILSRAKGNNAVAAAAYRSGECLYETLDLSDQQKPLSHNYSRKAGVMSSFILAPRDAPVWATHRGKLWNKVEEAEKRKDAQVAREVIVSLPSVDIFNHLNTQNKSKALRKFYERLLKRYVNDNFIKEGMIADVALHEPSMKNDERHFHAHIMLTMRKVGYEDDLAFGAKERDWNSPAKLEGWRGAWSHVVNDTLKRHRVEAFIDHRTYEERGLDIGVTKPLGSDNHKLEKLGIKTPVGNDNRAVKAANQQGHKYLERLFEHSPTAPEHEILAAIERAGHDDPEKVRDLLEKEGTLIRLYAKETGLESGLWTFSPMKKRADVIKKTSETLHNRNHYSVPVDVVQSVTGKRRDKAVREALNYTAQPQGFKVIEAANNGHRNTYLSSCKQMYQEAGYDVIALARTNQGKDSFKAAGFSKGILTYRDFLRRFGERYTGAKSTSRKVIIVDDADQLSPLQDKEIFKTAQKIDAKLIYIGSPKHKSKRRWHSLFSYYALLTAFKRLKHTFFQKQESAKRISEAFTSARTYEALKLQSKRSAKYLNAYANAADAKQGVLDAWFSRMKRRHDHRFILTTSDKDAQLFNFAIQKKRLQKKHLARRYGETFSVAYPSDNNTTLRRDMFVYRGDQIQFKKPYKALGIEEGTRATVRIHYSKHSLLELDDGRLIEVNLKEHNGFDLGYAGRIVSPSDTKLEQGYIYHTQANALDDAPMLYQNSEKPVRLFYDENIASNLEELSSQLLGRRHNLYDGFIEASENTLITEEVDESSEDTQKSDDNHILTNRRENTPED